MPRLCAWLVAGALLALGSMDLNAADEPKLEMSKDEKALLELTNKERAKEKLPPLEPNIKLFQAARGHSANMAAKGEMNHILDKKDPSDRVDATGYQWMAVGENVAATDKDTLEGVMKKWMASDQHRANILGKDFRDIGVGLAKDAKGDTYFTLVFATPLKK